jgi:mRNA-degrading endonuclease RelE of RelBE toxin-antitoxin system
MPELRWHPNVAALLATLSDEQREKIGQRVRALARFPLLGRAQPGSPTASLRRLIALGWRVVYRNDQVADVVTVLALVPPRSAIDLSD